MNAAGDGANGGKRRDERAQDEPRGQNQRAEKLAHGEGSRTAATGFFDEMLRCGIGDELITDERGRAPENREQGDGQHVEQKLDTDAARGLQQQKAHKQRGECDPEFQRGFLKEVGQEDNGHRNEGGEGDDAGKKGVKQMRSQFGHLAPEAALLAAVLGGEQLLDELLHDLVRFCLKTVPHNDGDTFLGGLNGAVEVGQERDHRDDVHETAQLFARRTGAAEERNERRADEDPCHRQEQDEQPLILEQVLFHAPQGCGDWRNVPGRSARP